MFHSGLDNFNLVHAGLLVNSNRSCSRGMLHNKIHLISPGCPWPSTVQIYCLNHHSTTCDTSFFYSELTKLDVKAIMSVVCVHKAIVDEEFSIGARAIVNVHLFPRSIRRLTVTHTPLSLHIKVRAHLKHNMQIE